VLFVIFVLPWLQVKHIFFMPCIKITVEEFKDME
jgi:hypothetical protein